ncbi:hypothetical protein ACFL3H_07210, partial [Gemmatimonadota bacterium]
SRSRQQHRGRETPAGDDAGGRVDQEEGSSSSCIICHSALEGPGAGEGIVHDFGLSSHSDAGLDCSDCHGGNPDVPVDLETFDYAAAKGRGTGFRGAPDRDEIPSFCGRCHSDAEYMRRFAPQQRVDQEQLYQISGHGRALQEGNTRVATCVDCHSTHRIMSASDPRSSISPARVPGTCTACHEDPAVMSGSGHSVAVGNDYRGSVHGMALLERGDLGAPACNDCHGNHGAAPPGVNSVSAVCSQCHVSTAADFQNSPHQPIFEMMGEPACEVCHGNHAIKRTSDEMLMADGICFQCHVSGDVGATVAGSFVERLRSLRQAISNADSLLTVALHKGMEIDEGRYILNQAQNKLVQGRAAIHTFTIDRLADVTDAGQEIAIEAAEFGLSAIDEFARRRGGLQVFLFLCVVVVIGTWKLIRRFEGPGGKYPLREPD